MKRFAAIFLGTALLLSAQFNTRRAPGFSLPDTKQKQVDLADFRGKLVVIDFMRTDCPKCQEVTKILEAVKQKYGDALQVLSVVIAPADNLQSVQKYISTYKVTSPILFDCGQMTASYLKITPQNPTVHLPTVFVIDKSGMIRRELSGEAIDATTLLGALEAAK